MDFIIQKHHYDTFHAAINVSERSLHEFSLEVFDELDRPPSRRPPLSLSMPRLTNFLFHAFSTPMTGKYILIRFLSNFDGSRASTVIEAGFMGFGGEGALANPRPLTDFIPFSISPQIEELTSNDILSLEGRISLVLLQGNYFFIASLSRVFYCLSY